MAQCKGKHGERWYHSIIHYNVKHFKGSYGRPESHISSILKVLGQNPPGQNPPGQNPPDKIPLDKIPPRTKSPRTKSPWTKSPHYIPPNCSIAQYFLLYINVIFEGQFSSTFVRCDIFHGHKVEKRS